MPNQNPKLARLNKAAPALSRHGLGARSLWGGEGAVTRCELPPVGTALGLPSCHQPFSVLVTARGDPGEAESLQMGGEGPAGERGTHRKVEGGGQVAMMWC